MSMLSDSQTRQNVIVILCDQLRKDFLNVYGCDAISTPNIDSIAKNGIVFDNAITQSAVCAPARATMMTGRFVSDHNVWTNDIPFRDGIDEYIAQRMNKLGYKTGCFGKMHHYPARDLKGFQTGALMEESRLGIDDDYLKWLKSKYPSVSGIFNFDPASHQFDFEPEDHYEYWIASKANDFISSQSKEPFFAWISFQGPHGPLDPPKQMRGKVSSDKLPKPLLPAKELQDGIGEVVKYRQVCAGSNLTPEENLKMRTAYAEKILFIDMQIGRILERLKELGLFENTTIIFSADHGDMLGDYCQDQKGPMPFSPQLNIPLIVSNHPGVAAGTRTDNLAGNIDIPGTVLDAAGDSQSIGVSRSLIDLSKQVPCHPREVIFSEFCDSIKIVENKQYRLCYYPFTGVCELYDKLRDPYEKNNLSNCVEHTAIKLKLMQDIVDFMVVAKGIRIEAHDFVPSQQKGVEAKFPEYQRHYEVCFPLSKANLEDLQKAGLSTDYNKFCESKDVFRHYGYYWQK